MAVTDPDEIKRIVSGNFDRSVEKYADFEDEHGLFSLLTQALAAMCGVSEGMSVCDAGCGAGDSTFALEKIVGAEGKVTGVDISPGMLEAARGAAADSPGVGFVLGDAARLDEGDVGRDLDAVLYNASIFLIPDTAQSLSSASSVLKDGGAVGMTYLLGVHDRPAARGEGSAKGDLLAAARDAEGPFAPYGRSLMDVGRLPAMVEEAGFTDVDHGVISVEAGRRMLRGFYHIPAQSSALYPKTPYEERLGLLEMLLDHLEERTKGNMFQWWGWAVGWK